MYDRITDRARQVLHLAKEEALRDGGAHLRPEYIFLGLLKEGQGVGYHALQHLLGDDKVAKLREKFRKLALDSKWPQKRNVSSEHTDRADLRQLVWGARVLGRFPQTPQASRAIQLGVQEARRLGHGYVGTEHLLLGLMHDPTIQGLAEEFGLQLGPLRDEILRMLGPDRAPLNDVVLLLEEVRHALDAVTEELGLLDEEKRLAEAEGELTAGIDTRKGFLLEGTLTALEEWANRSRR
jgi:ATP-dependent Clp protease ATP-binding subunit ClpC